MKKTTIFRGENLSPGFGTKENFKSIKVKEYAHAQNIEMPFMMSQTHINSFLRKRACSSSATSLTESTDTDSDDKT